MKILILGGSGFIGSNLIKSLENTNHEILSYSKSTGLDIRDYNQISKKNNDIKT